MPLRFFWRGEGTTLDSVADFSAGDTTATAQGTIACDSTVAVVPGNTNSIRPQSGGAHYRFDNAGIHDDLASEGSLAFVCKLTSAPTGYAEYGVKLYGTSTATNNVTTPLVTTGFSTDTGQIRFRHAGTTLTPSGAGAALSLNTVYGVVCRWDQPNSLRKLEIYDSSGTLIEAVTNTNAFTAPTWGTASATLRIGESSGFTVASGIANAMVADTYAEPLEDYLFVNGYDEIGGDGVTPAAGALALSAYTPTVLMNIFRAVSVGALSLVGHAPTVTLNAPNTKTPSSGSLALAGIVPTVLRGNVGLPAAGTLAISGYAPTVSQSTPPNIIPASAAVALTGYAPVISQLGRIIIPSVGALGLTGNQPELTLQVNPPSSGAAAFTGYAPTISISGNVTLSPPSGALGLNGNIPTIGVLVAPMPGAGSLALTTYAPTVSRIDNHYRTPNTAALGLSGQLPGVQSGDNTYRNPTVGSLAFTAYAPTVSVSNVSVRTPAAGALTIGGAAPVLAQTGHVNITPPTGWVFFSGKRPVRNGENVGVVVPDMAMEADELWVDLNGDM